MFTHIFVVITAALLSPCVSGRTGLASGIAEETIAALSVTNERTRAESASKLLGSALSGRTTEEAPHLFSLGDCNNTCNGKDIEDFANTECWGRFEQKCKGEHDTKAVSICEGALFATKRAPGGGVAKMFARCEGMTKTFFFHVESGNGTDMMHASGYGCFGNMMFLLNPEANGTKEYIGCSDHAAQFNAAKNAEGLSVSEMVAEMEAAVAAFVSDILGQGEPPRRGGPAPRGPPPTLVPALIAPPPKSDPLLAWNLSASHCPAAPAADKKDDEEDDGDDDDDDDGDDSDDDDDDSDDDEGSESDDEGESEGGRGRGDDDDKDEDDEDDDSDADDDDDDAKRAFASAGVADISTDVSCNVTCNGEKPSWLSSLACRGTFEVRCAGTGPTGKCFAFRDACKGLTVPWLGMCWGLHTVEVEADKVKVLELNSGKHIWHPVSRDGWKGMASFSHGKSSIHIGGEGYGKH